MPQTSSGVGSHPPIKVYQYLTALEGPRIFGFNKYSSTATYNLDTNSPGMQTFNYKSTTNTPTEPSIAPKKLIKIDRIGARSTDPLTTLEGKMPNEGEALIIAHHTFTQDDLAVALPNHTVQRVDNGSEVLIPHYKFKLSIPAVTGSIATKIRQMLLCQAGQPQEYAAYYVRLKEFQ